MITLNVSPFSKSIAVFHVQEGVRTNIALQVNGEYYLYGDYNGEETCHQTSVHMFDWFMHEYGVLKKVNSARAELGLQ